jgi:hypothetical protein
MMPATELTLGRSYLTSDGLEVTFRDPGNLWPQLTAGSSVAFNLFVTAEDAVPLFTKQMVVTVSGGPDQVATLDLLPTDLSGAMVVPGVYVMRLTPTLASDSVVADLQGVPQLCEVFQW